MNTTMVHFLVEEPSMAELIQAIAPKVLPEVHIRTVPFQSKQDLLKKLSKRLRGYARSRPPGLRIVVLVDRDSQDCLKLKQVLEDHVHEARLTTRSTTTGADYDVLVRIVVEELESWYFGDWDAVRTTYPKVSARAIHKQAFKDPDAIRGGTWERFERVLKKHGYFGGGLRKIEAARAIGRHMEPSRNTSLSFRCFWEALREFRPESAGA